MKQTINKSLASTREIRLKSTNNTINISRISQLLADVARDCPDVVLSGWRQQIKQYQQAQREAAMYDIAIEKLQRHSDPLLVALKDTYVTDKAKCEMRMARHKGLCYRYQTALREARGVKAVSARRQVDTQMLKAQIDMRDIVARYTPVQRNKALCPAHNDTRPSMHVYRDGVHCFTCGFHEDVFGFVRKVEGCGFREAARKVAV